MDYRIMKPNDRSTIEYYFGTFSGTLIPSRIDQQDEVARRTTVAVIEGVFHSGDYVPNI
jgi:hypothetical protein